LKSLRLIATRYFHLKVFSPALAGALVILLAYIGQYLILSSKIILLIGLLRLKPGISSSNGTSKESTNYNTRRDTNDICLGFKIGAYGYKVGNLGPKMGELGSKIWAITLPTNQQANLLTSMI